MVLVAGELAKSFFLLKIGLLDTTLLFCSFAVAGMVLMPCCRGGLMSQTEESLSALAIPSVMESVGTV